MGRRHRRANIEKHSKWENNGKHLWGIDHWDEPTSPNKPNLGDSGGASDYDDIPETIPGPGCVWFPSWAPFMTSGYGLGSDPMGDQYTTITSYVTCTDEEGNVTVIKIVTVYNSAGDIVSTYSEYFPVSAEDDVTSEDSNDVYSQSDVDDSDLSTNPSETVEVFDHNEPEWNDTVFASDDEVYAFPAGDTGEDEADETVIVESSSTYVPNTDNIYKPPKEEESTDHNQPSDKELYTQAQITVVVESNPGKVLSGYWQQKLEETILDKIFGVDVNETIYVYANPFVPSFITAFINDQTEATIFEDPILAEHYNECINEYYTALKDMDATSSWELYDELAELYGSHIEIECHSYMPIINLYAEGPQLKP